MKLRQVRHLRLMALLIALVVVFDQLSKMAILEIIRKGQEMAIIPGFFSLVLTFNKGSAFGLFADLPGYVRIPVLTAAMLTALVVLLYLLVHDYYDSLMGQVAVALILGGAVGNIVDRIRFGQVVDFLDFYYGRYHWPAFNVADSAVCIGVVILLFVAPKKSDG